MRKLKVYLDTSVISHLQQEDVPEKMHETQELWRQFKERPDVDIIISDLVIREISKCSEPKLSFLLRELAQIDYKMVQVTEEERGLADIYLKNGGVQYALAAGNRPCRHCDGSARHPVLKGAGN